MKLVILSCLLALTYVAADQTPIVLCGRQLANARAILCDGAEYVVNKKSRTMSPEDYLPGNKMNEVDWTWGRRGPLSVNWSRNKRSGLADECCLKPCTTDVILNYC